MRAARHRFFPCLEQPSPPVPRATLRARDARSAMSTPDEGSGDDPLLLGAERSTAPAFAANAPSRHDALDPFDDSDDDGARVARPDGFHGVTPSWNIILNSMLYMAAPLSMPATTAAGGWFWSFVFWAYCSCATYWTGLVVGRAYNANPSCDLSTYPRMAGEAFARLSLRRDPSDALAARAWRRRASLSSSAPNSSPSTSTPSPRSYSSPSTSRRSSRRPARVRGSGSSSSGSPPCPSCRYQPSTPRDGSSSQPSPSSSLPCVSSSRRFSSSRLGTATGPDVSTPDVVVSLRLPRQLRVRLRRPRNVPGIVAGDATTEGLAAGHAMVLRRDDAAVPGVRRRRISRVRRLRQGERQPQFSGQPSQRRVAGFANPADVLPRLLHQRRHDHRRGTTRARDRTRIRGRGRSRTRRESQRDSRFEPRGWRRNVSSRLHSCPAARKTSSSTRRRSREPWE